MPGARSLVVACAVLPLGLAGVAVADGVSNAPFLGIGMEDRGPGVGVLKVTPGTGADHAGLQDSDIIVAMDGVPLADTSPSARNSQTKAAVLVLADRIVAHTVGDQVLLRVLRNGALHDITAVLSTRADVMQQHLVGSELDVPGVDLDSDAETDLAELAGRTTVVGWTVRENNNDRCLGCVAVLQRLDERLHERSPDAPHVVLVTSDRSEDVRRDRDQAGATMPVLLADRADIERTLAIVDVRRLGVTISDARGVGQFVSVILPGADDEDAVIDEIVAAVEQAGHPAHR